MFCMVKMSKEMGTDLSLKLLTGGSNGCALAVVIKKLNEFDSIRKKSTVIKPGHPIPNHVSRILNLHPSPSHLYATDMLSGSAK